MTDLAKLIERVENGSGEDRELEVDIWSVLQPQIGTKYVRVPGANNLEKWHWLSRFDSQWCGITKSIDAVVELTEKVLPGWGWNIHARPKDTDGWSKRSPDAKKFQGQVWERYALSAEDDKSIKQFDSECDTAPRALLSALLKAKQEGE